MNVKFGSCFVLLLVALSVNAQNDLSPDLVKLSETELETMTEKTDSEQEDYQHYDALEQYLRSPLNLNKSSLHELEVFPFLDDMRIAALLQHRENFGEIIAIEELQLVPGFDADLIRTIKPLVSLGNLAGQKPISVKNLVVEGTNTLMIRVQKKIESGNTNESLYPGSDEKIYLRYKYQFSDRIRFGFTAEKDPGEYFFNNSRTNGFDFYSGHLIYKSKSFIRQIIIGDFAMQHGQGLVMWSGMGLGKSSEVLNIQKNTIGSRPYTSVDENNFLRGSCVTIQVRDWRSEIFYSSHKKDGNISGEFETEGITSFQTSGYHRTDAELADKGSVHETITGIALNRTKGLFSIGGIATMTSFSKELIRDDAAYSKFEFSGTENMNAGVHYKYLYKNVNTFGEVGISKNGGMGFLWGSMIHLHPKISQSFLFRHYEKDYQALHSAALAEGSKLNNETGIFTGVNFKLPKTFNFSVYVDYFKFPWLKYMVDAPSSGYEFLTILKWKPKRTFETYLLFKSKLKSKNNSETVSAIKQLEENKTSSLRWNMRIKLNETWEWGSRVEHSMFKTGDQNNRFGFLIFQDILFHPLNFPLSFGVRYAIFDTDDYDTRIYAYENDVLFSYSVPAMQGRGDRLYLNTHIRLGKMLDLWLRYSITSTNKETETSSIDQQKPAPVKEIKAQIRFRF